MFTSKNGGGFLGLIDSHAHLSSETFWPNIHSTLAAAKSAGIMRIVNICTDSLSLERGLQLALDYPWIANAAATTPHDVEKEGEEFFPQAEAAAIKGKLIAIGETGLDYHYEHSPRSLQQTFLRRYFALAIRHRLPIVIHCRDAFDDLCSIADECYLNRPLLLHCFTGTVKEAQEALKRGWKISFSGIVTFKKSQELRDVVKVVPLTEMLVETDAPYLAPQNKRGRMNEPAFLTETAQCIADVKQVDINEVSMATKNGALAFFWPGSTGGLQEK